MHITYNRYVTRVVGACGFGAVVSVLACLVGIAAALPSLGTSAVLGCVGVSSAVLGGVCATAAALDACY